MGNHTKTSEGPETSTGFQISVQPLVEGDEPGSVVKYHSAANVSSLGSGEQGELPKSYGGSTIYLVAQEPHRLFTYWDLDISQHPGGPAVIRCLKGNPGEIEVEFEVPFEARNWYIPVSRGGTPYRVEIGFYRTGNWNLLAVSETVSTPRDFISKDDSFEFATLPLDTAFSALLASLPPQVRHHPELMRHLAGLQKKQAADSPDISKVSRNEEAMQLLQSLLGDALLLQLLSGSWDSAVLSSAIHGKLEEALSSRESSMLLDRFQQVASESTLFSGIVEFIPPAGGSSPETLSSGSISSENLGAGSFSSESLSGWTESLVSWAHAARHAAASEWLSSWQLAPGGQSPAGLSSESSIPLAGASSWFSLFATSWEKAGGASRAAGGISAPESSWSGANLSSWSESALSSWFGETVSSWSAESLSSWTRELLSSWSAAESGSWPSAPAERGFFMHVNAELIFYGGTHPDAKVTIDGKPVALQPGGTFHYHFVFPDGTYEIPIIATSPDGRETRKAILRFERGTLREGKVDATEQSGLSAPMGKR